MQATLGSRPAQQCGPLQCNRGRNPPPARVAVWVHRCDSHSVALSLCHSVTPSLRHRRRSSHSRCGICCSHPVVQCGLWSVYLTAGESRRSRPFSHRGALPTLDDKTRNAGVVTAQWQGQAGQAHAPPRRSHQPVWEARQLARVPSGHPKQSFPARSCGGAGYKARLRATRDGRPGESWEKRETGSTRHMIGGALGSSSLSALGCRR